MSWRLLVVQLPLLGSMFAFSHPCELRTVPEQVQRSLTSEYAGWNVVTPSMLETSDRRTWLESYSKECPGFATGKFSNTVDGYVFNLVKNEAGRTFQQVIYYQSSEGRFAPLVVLPRTVVKVVTVVRKFPPGRYKSVDGGKPLMIKTDTIGISQIDAWTVVYYWDGAGFRHTVTSE